MKLILENSAVYSESGIKRGRFVIEAASSVGVCDNRTVVYTNKCVVLPGFCDVHVHFREPGFSYKEDIASGSAAASHGGYTAVCTMPNLSPAPDSVENIRLQLDAIHRHAKIGVYPYGTISRGERGEELSDFAGLAPYAVAFSDDGRGVQSESLMYRAMCEAARYGKMIVAHCEDNSLLRGGYIHDGEYARAHGHAGISSSSEWVPLERDLRLAEKSGCAYHVCHISTKESVELIRAAKARGVNVTCETAPHYLVLCDDDLEEDGRFKMNPPLRSRADRDALLEGICDGTIDMIATDHAPHTEEEKGGGLKDSLMGVVGLECAFEVLYTKLVMGGVITLEKLVSLMSTNPRRRFGITGDVGMCVRNIEDVGTVDPGKFLSKGRSTPFDGMSVYGGSIATVYNGKFVYEGEELR